MLSPPPPPPTPLAPKSKSAAASPLELTERDIAAPQALDRAAPAPAAPQALDRAAPAPAAPQAPDLAGAAALAALPAAPPGRVERFVEGEVGEPGPLERLVERARPLARVLYLALGLRALLLLALLDSLWELVSGYVQGVFQGLMSLRAARRVAARRAAGRLAAGTAEDAAAALALTRSLLCAPSALCAPLSGRATEEAAALVALEGRDPLALALAARARLDDLRRDLRFLHPGGAGRTLREALVGYVVDLIPNPLSLFRPWVNWLAVCLALRFRRREALRLCAELEAGVGGLLAALEGEGGGARAPRAATPASRAALSAALPAAEDALGRLLLLTVLSHHHANPDRWAPLDLAADLWASRRAGGAPARVVLGARVAPRALQHPAAALALAGLLSRELCGAAARVPGVGPLDVAAALEAHAAVARARRAAGRLRRRAAL
ncbi:MAG: hypothetical protein FJ138_10220 [Deltaproteobacteria bacterium]|nr:hypothetical protein [Deltaproteobacteria bacterium]